MPLHKCPSCNRCGGIHCVLQGRSFRIQCWCHLVPLCWSAKSPTMAIHDWEQGLPCKWSTYHTCTYSKVYTLPEIITYEGQWLDWCAWFGLDVGLQMQCCFISYRKSYKKLHLRTLWEVFRRNKKVSMWTLYGAYRVTRGSLAWVKSGI
jgi:hypothetical protein